MTAGIIDKYPSINTLIVLIVGILFTVASVTAIITINRQMKKEALVDAKIQARIILDRNLAIHDYFATQLKPKLFTVLDPLVRTGYFAPEWMSSTYAVREINKLSRAFSDYHYYYKECAINARSPQNEADDYERSFIRKLNSDPKLIENTAVRVFDGKPYFVVLRRGETMDSICLRCHSTPAAAPSGMVQRYGDKRSYERSEGEVVSAVSIRIPLASAYERANRTSLNLSLFMTLILGCLYALILWLNKRLLISPLRSICDKVEQIGRDGGRLGEEIPLPHGRELRDMAASFNAMSKNIRNSIDQLARQSAEQTAISRKLQESEEKHRELIQKIQAAIVVFGADTRILTSNLLAQQLLGLTEEQMMGKSAIDPDWHFYREDGTTMPPEEYPVNRVLITGQPIRDAVLRVHRPAMEKDIWVLVSGDPVLDEQGEIMQIVVTFVDITERKQTEEALRKSESELNKAQRLTHIGSWDWDAINDIIWWSDEYYRIYGLSSDKPTPNYSQHLMAYTQESAERLDMAVKRAMETGEPYELDLEFAKPTESRRWILARGEAKRDALGNILGLRGTAQNITERKQAEEELKDYREHLEELVKQRTAELEIAKERAESADRVKSAFLAIMSHELRTPLNSIIGFTGIMLQGMVGPLNEEQNKQLKMVRDSADHLLLLINDILDISKIEAGQMEVSFKPFNLRETIEGVIRSTKPLIEKKGLALYSNIAPEIGTIISDQRRVSQVLMNLLSNALKFTEKGEISVTCDTADSDIIISVIDTGIGIKQEDINKLFKPFTKLEYDTGHVYEGTGLGLSICRKLVNILGGEIWVESEWGKGSAFSFKLPEERGTRENQNSRHRR